jgi:SAM-dependent methyltransferase
VSAPIWHDVECGAYAADLPLWEELADAAGGPILELGAGTGRVALHLARRGHAVTALERDADLLAELRRRADADGLHAEVLEADARSFAIGKRFALVLAPMQIVQLLDQPGRESMLASIRAHLMSGGRAAIALANGEGLGQAGSELLQPLPDVREREGWIYSSLPIEVRSDGGEIEIRRLRQTVSPSGELSEKLDVTRLGALEPTELEETGRRHGLLPAGRREVPATGDHTGSVVVLLEASR